MTEHIPLEDLSAYVDEALGEHERGLVEAHLPACAACRRRREQLSQLAAIVRQRPAFPVPPFFAERLTALVRERQQQQSLIADFAWVGKRFAPALALLVGAILAWSSWHPVNAGLSLESYLSPADSTAATALLLQKDSELTTDDVLQLAVYEVPR